MQSLIIYIETSRFWQVNDSFCCIAFFQHLHQNLLSSMQAVHEQLFEYLPHELPGEVLRVLKPPRLASFISYPSQYPKASFNLRVGVIQLKSTDQDVPQPSYKSGCVDWISAKAIPSYCLNDIVYFPSPDSSWVIRVVCPNSLRDLESWIWYDPNRRNLISLTAPRK